MQGPRVSAGVDVGGTFTDVVVAIDDELIITKVPSTSDDQSVGVLAGLEASGVPITAIDDLAHGMTVATNALLERDGARTALVTTEGFRDVIEIGRQNRASLYDIAALHPAPLVPRELRFTVHERMGVEGVVLALQPASLSRLVDDLRAAQVEAVAVCLLFSFLHPAHEQRVAEELRSRLPGVAVSASFEVLPEFREYERTSTVTADAFVRPRLVTYLSELERRLRDTGAGPPLIMQSAGGVTTIQGAVSRAAACALSGPAGGVVGAAHVGRSSNLGDLLTFDMGGTSTDVALIVDGEVQLTTENVVAGVPIRFPMVDIHTVGAGGGSIGWIDEGGALRVGPRSAGASPGPIAYGRGGSEPTVTDAHLMLGNISPATVFGGNVRLEIAAVRRAFAALGRKLRLSPDDCAAGIVAIADAEMTRALRRISVERGLDPRDFTLLAFGGAGPLHALGVAEELGGRRVAIPRACGVLSALGLAIGDLRRDGVRPLRGDLDVLDARAVRNSFAELESEVLTELPGGTCRRFADLRYRGQAFELTVPADDWDGVPERFHASHQRRYGFRTEHEPLELVNVRVVATRTREVPTLRDVSQQRAGVASERQIYLDGAWRRVPVLARASLAPAASVIGPAIVEFPEATCLIRSGWRGTIDDVGTLTLER
jgi:N-methylhydantoinase A